MKRFLFSALFLGAFATGASAQVGTGTMTPGTNTNTYQNGRTSGSGTITPSSTPTRTITPGTRTNSDVLAPAMDNRTPVRGTSPEINRSNMINGSMDRNSSLPPVVPSTPAMPGGNPSAPAGTPNGTYGNPTGGGQNSNTGDGTNMR